MQVLNLKLNNFRSHISSYYDISDETYFIGENGTGKTSILESIYILFGLKSFKKQPFSSIISFNTDFFRIESEISEAEYNSNVVCLYKNKRSTLYNGEEVENIADYIYNYPVAFYTPENLGLLSKEQVDRRNFLDRFIFYYDKKHIYDIKTYSRLLSQKTAEFEKDNIDFTYINVLNEKLIYLSNLIYNKRLKMVDELNLMLKNIYSKLEFTYEEVFIKYTSNILDESLINKEKIMKKILYGVHRDKIEMQLQDKIIEKFSSTGQKKTFSLLSLYSFIKIIEENRKISIITLLDDFEAALDYKRASFIKGLYAENRQVLYTGVDNSRLDFKNIIKLN